MDRFHVLGFLPAARVEDRPGRIILADLGEVDGGTLVAELVRYPLADGQSILVEVDDYPRTAVRRSITVGDRIVDAGETLESVLGRMTPLIGTIVESVRRAGESPDVIEVEFGVKLSAEAGVVIARTAGEASFRLQLRWVQGEPG
jgi:Trypsin-co-occurring domain 1